MTWNTQDTFLSRFKLGTAGAIAKSVNNPITTTALVSSTDLVPGQGVLLVINNDALLAFPPSSTDLSLTVRGIVMLRANSLPDDTTGEIVYAIGEVVDILLNGFIYVPLASGSVSSSQPYTPAIPDFANNDFEWATYVPNGSEQRIKPIQFVHPVPADDLNLGDVDTSTQIVYIPDQALDRAVDNTGSPI